MPQHTKNDKPLYTRVYYINLPELLQNKDKYISGEILPIATIVDNYPNTNEVGTEGNTENHGITTVSCPDFHVKSIIRLAPKFDEEHPCVVFEYCGRGTPTSEPQIGTSRILPNAAIDTNKPNFPDDDTSKDFERRIRIQQSWLFPTKHKHGH